MSRLAVFIAAPWLAACAGAPSRPPWTPPTARALTYLQQEVPRWRPANGCFSCHHNGDAARALYSAQSRGDDSGLAALAQTTGFLGQPAMWDQNGDDAPYVDTTLARVQFATTLAAATDAGVIGDPDALRRAVALVTAVQSPDGAWRVDAAGTVGSPATYGSLLTTAQAVRLLRRANGRVDTLARGEQWLRAARVNNVPQAAAAMLALRDADDAAASAQVARSRALLLAAQGPEGGWGPFASDAPEPFDTALAVLALAGDDAAAAARGRRFLIEEQQPDGSWIETTRPAGYESTAQRLSTAGWATLALIITEPR